MAGCNGEEDSSEISPLESKMESFQEDTEKLKKSKGKDAERLDVCDSESLNESKKDEKEGNLDGKEAERLDVCESESLNESKKDEKEGNLDVPDSPESSMVSPIEDSEDSSSMAGSLSEGVQGDNEGVSDDSSELSMAGSMNKSMQSKNVEISGEYSFLPGLEAQRKTDEYGSEETLKNSEGYSDISEESTSERIEVTTEFQEFEAVHQTMDRILREVSGEFRSEDGLLNMLNTSAENVNHDENAIYSNDDDIEIVEEIIRYVPPVHPEIIRNVPSMHPEIIRNVPSMHPEIIRNVPSMHPHIQQEPTIDNFIDTTSKNLNVDDDDISNSEVPLERIPYKKQCPPPNNPHPGSSFRRVLEIYCPRRQRACGQNQAFATQSNPEVLIPRKNMNRFVRLYHIPITQDPGPSTQSSSEVTKLAVVQQACDQNQESPTQSYSVPNERTSIDAAAAESDDDVVILKPESDDDIIVLEDLPKTGQSTGLDYFKHKSFKQIEPPTDCQRSSVPNPSRTPASKWSNKARPSNRKEDTPGMKREELKKSLRKSIQKNKAKYFKSRFYLREDSEDAENLSDEADNSDFKKVEKISSPGTLEGNEEISENIEVEATEGEELTYYRSSFHIDDDLSSDEKDESKEVVKNVEEVDFMCKKRKRCVKLDDDSDDDSTGYAKRKKGTDNEEKSAESQSVADLASSDETLKISSKRKCSELDSDSSEDLSENSKKSKNAEKSQNIDNTSSSQAILKTGGNFSNQENVEDSCPSEVPLHFDENFKEDVSKAEDSSKSKCGDENLQEKTFPKTDDKATEKFWKESMKDLPITDNESQIFKTQDLNKICSGNFEGEIQDPPEGQSECEGEIFETEHSKSEGKISEMEQHFESEDETSDVEQSLEHGSPPCETGQNFLDVEAELSGDDDNVDDPDEEEDEENLSTLINDDDNDEEETENKAFNLYRKQVDNDDDLLAKKIQEDFVQENENDTKRSRKFAWSKNNEESAFAKEEEDNSENEDVPDVDPEEIEKMKFKQENVEKELTDQSVDLKRPTLKMQIIGKPGSKIENEKKELNKKLRGSFIECSQEILPHLKIVKVGTEEEVHGSRSTRNFVFTAEDKKKIDIARESNSTNVSNSIFDEF